MFVMFATVAVLVAFGVHFYFYRRLVVGPNLPAPWRRRVTVAIILLGAGLPLALILPRLLPVGVTRIVLLGDSLPDVDVLDLCRAVRGLDGCVADALPMIVVTNGEGLDRAAGSAAGVSDWFVEPFSTIYARTRIRTWDLCGTTPTKQPGDSVFSDVSFISPSCWSCFQSTIASAGLCLFIVKPH